jgi:hypothetical protein
LYRRNTTDQEGKGERPEEGCTAKKLGKRGRDGNDIQEECKGDDLSSRL